MLAVPDVLDDGVAAREEQPLVSVVVPPHEERRTPILAVHLQDLGVTVRLTHVMALDDQPVSDVRSHDGHSLFVCRSVSPLCAGGGGGDRAERPDWGRSALVTAETRRENHVMSAGTPWVELAETHSAVVFFVGDRAYKLKKPVRFDFLDFSTPERREQAVRRELALNRRIAPDVYLGVAEVHGVDGAVCDHLLVMRRLPGDRRLAALVRSDSVADEDLRAVARIVATFHAGAARGDGIAAAGSPTVIEAKLAADLEELRALPAGVLQSDDVDDVARRATRYVEGRRRLFDQRVAAGWICDGHGDLLADDVFLLADGPRVLDCLDFSDELRYGDVLADVAFLAMDLEHLGAPALSQRFVDHYCELSGEHHPETLVHFYVAFRALIRAKVSALRHEQGDEAARATAVELLDLARARLRRSSVRLTVVGGAPGTGKSTVARGPRRS